MFATKPQRDKKNNANTHAMRISVNKSLFFRMIKSKNEKKYVFSVILMKKIRIQNSKISESNLSFYLCPCVDQHFYLFLHRDSCFFHRWIQQKNKISASSINTFGDDSTNETLNFGLFLYCSLITNVIKWQIIWTLIHRDICSISTERITHIASNRIKTSVHTKFFF